MFGSKPAKPKERERYYLLPGMGGRAYRRKQMLFLKIALAVGVLTSGAVVAVFYFVGRR